jgi:hypothetical protein
MLQVCFQHSPPLLSLPSFIAEDFPRMPTRTTRARPSLHAGGPTGCKQRLPGYSSSATYGSESAYG